MEPREQQRFDDRLPAWLGGDNLIGALNRFYAEMLADEASLERFFSPDYIQRANGHVLDYGQLVTHLAHIRRFSSETRFVVEEAVAAGGVVAERHVVEMRDASGERLAVETSCFIRFDRQRIVDMYEVYRLVEGEEVYRRFVASE
jgi:hypothetical protein